MSNRPKKIEPDVPHRAVTTERVEQTLTETLSVIGEERMRISAQATNTLEHSLRLRKANDELEHAYAILLELIADIKHDAKNRHRRATDSK